MNNNVIKTKRLVKTGTVKKFPSGEVYQVENVGCYLEPQDPRKASQYVDGQDVFRAFLAVFCESVDIVEGDRLFDQSGDQYKVKGVLHHDNDELESTTEVVLVKKS